MTREGWYTRDRSAFLSTAAERQPSPKPFGEVTRELLPLQPGRRRRIDDGVGPKCTHVSGLRVTDRVDDVEES